MYNSNIQGSSQQKEIIFLDKIKISSTSNANLKRRPWNHEVWEW